MAAISLNTLYFYDSNKGLHRFTAGRAPSTSSQLFVHTAVGGCEFGDRDDPGNLQLDWLEVQLETYRERGMQVRVFILVTSCFVFYNRLCVLGLAYRSRTSIFWKLLPRVCECVYAYERYFVSADLFSLKHVRYAELSLRFQDTILGHIYGVSVEKMLVQTGRSSCVRIIRV